MAKQSEPPVDPHRPVPGLESPEWPIVPSQAELMHDPAGRELLSPHPVEVPVQYRHRTDPVGDQIRRLISAERTRIDLANAGIETPEEADDFDLPDDPMVLSPYDERLLVGLNPISPAPPSEPTQGAPAAAAASPTPPAPEGGA